MRYADKLNWRMFNIYENDTFACWSHPGVYVGDVFRQISANAGAQLKVPTTGPC